MARTEECPKCGSDRVIGDVRIADALDEEVGAEVDREPRAMLLKGTVRVPLKARVCGACGHAELYVSEPQKLLRAHQHGEHKGGR